MISHRTAFLAAIATGVLLSTPAAAQPKPLDSIDQTKSIETINEKSVVPALEVVTGNHIAGVDPQGNATLIATATNGLRFEVNFRACEPVADTEERHCKAMYMMSVWDPVSGASEGEFQTALSGYLQNNPAINSGRLNNGSPYIVRYVIADFGTRQGNLVSEFANFIRSATDFQNAIAPLYAQEQ